MIANLWPLLANRRWNAHIGPPVELVKAWLQVHTFNFFCVQKQSSLSRGPMWHFISCKLTLSTAHHIRVRRLNLLTVGFQRWPGTLVSGKQGRRWSVWSSPGWTRLGWLPMGSGLWSRRSRICSGVHCWEIKLFYTKVCYILAPLLSRHLDDEGLIDSSCCWFCRQLLVPPTVSFIPKSTGHFLGKGPFGNCCCCQQLCATDCLLFLIIIITHGLFLSHQLFYEHKENISLEKGFLGLNLTFMSQLLN